jgi:hypothetical protein
VVPGAGFSLYFSFEPATSGFKALAPFDSPDYESGALARLGYPGELSPFFWLFSFSLSSMI